MEHTIDSSISLAVLDALEDMIAVFDNRGAVLAANQAWQRFAAENGASGPAWTGVGSNYLDALRKAAGESSAEAPAILAGLQSVLDGQQNCFSIEYPSHSPEQKKWFHLQATPLTTKEGGVVVSLTDITGREQAIEARRESEERYQKLVSVMPAAMFTVDAEGLITFFNQRAAEVWGREPKLRDPQDRYCGSFHLYRPNGAAMRHDQCPMAEAVLYGHAARDKEIMIEQPDGTFINASVNVDPLYDENGVRIGAINVFRDITEEKRLWAENQRYKAELEDRILERTRELEEVNQTLLAEIEERKRIDVELEEVQRRMMDRVETERLKIAREIHDGPIQDLFAVLYRFAYLREENEKDIERDEILKAIREDVYQVNETLRTIIKNLRPATLAPFGLEKAIREHAQNIKQIYPDLDIRLELAPDRQTLPEPVRLVLYRIFQAVMTNVIRHAQAGQVSTRFAYDAEEAILVIEDDGRGFALPQRWIEFARKGRLGLIGSIERAESIGGQLEISSTLGGGTRVQVTVPVRLRTFERLNV